jgi:HEAT repeat protein
MDRDPDRRWWAARTLAVIGTAAAVEPLVDLLADPDEATRCAASLALGRIGAEAAIPALVARLADPSGWVRDSAADGLALIGEASLPALVEALSDPRDGIRVRAASALRRTLLAIIPPRTHVDIASNRGRALGALFQALNDPNYLVHQHAYEALDRLGLLDNLIVK